MPEMLEVLVFVNYAGGRTVQGRNATLKIASLTTDYNQHLKMYSCRVQRNAVGAWVVVVSPAVAGARQDRGSASAAF